MTTTTVPDYTEIVRKAQTAAQEIAQAQGDAVRAFAEIRSPFSVATNGTLPDAGVTLDGIFDYASQALAIQHSFAKRVTAATV